MPFKDLSLSNLQYLTTNQILADIDEFIKEINKRIDKLYGEGSKKEWMIVGGGYAGAVAAWYQARYNNTATGIWASSAPIRALQNFPDYDYAVY